MPLPPDPRGNSVDTPQPDARPSPQIQTPAAKPIPHPGQTAVAALASATPVTPHHTPVAPNPKSEIPNPKSQLTDSASHELAKLKSQLHALASPDGFAPTRDEFARAIRRTSRPYCKFFKTYDDFIRSCGLRSAVDRRRELAADQRAAAWAAARDPSPSSPAPTNAHSQSAAAHDNSSFQSPIRNPQSAIRNHSPTPKPKPRTNETFYGDPIHCCDMAHAPVNEQGVVLLFGILARKLNYRIEMVRTGYPDCEAKRKGPDGKWRRLRIEFEFKTSRFNHDPAGCDLIVCWEDDANPTKLEVLELKNHVGQEPSNAQEPAESSTKTPIAAVSEAPSLREGVGGRESFTQQPPTSQTQTSLHSEAASQSEGSVLCIPA
jgi:hypothetical protein